MTTASITITASDKTQTAFRSVENNLAGISNRMGVVMGAVAGLAGAAGFGMLVKSSMQSADDLAKTSDALGIATEKLASMRYMGDLAGVSADQMDANLKKMTQSLGEAAQGGGSAAKTLEALHLNAAELVQLSPDQQYLAIADSINSLGTQAEKAAAANDIFGRSGVDMLNVMAGGSETFRQAEEEANNFGIAISRIDAAKIEMANDSFTRVGKVVEGMGNAIAITAAPMLEDLANRFVNLIGGADGFRNAAQFMTDVTVNAVGLLADGFHGLHIVFEGIGAAFWTVVEKLMQGLDWLQKQVVEFLNLLPGVDIKPMESFTKATQFAADTAETARRNLQALVMEPLPSDNVKQWSQDVQQKAQEAAAKVAAVSQAVGGQTVFDTSSSAPVDTKSAESADREKQRLQEQLEQLQQHYMTKEELLAQNLEKQQFMIEESFQNNLISDQERRDLLMSTEQEYQDGLTAITDEAAKKRAAIEQQYTDVVNNLKSSTFNHAVQLLGALGGQSKTAAKAAIILQKAMTIAQIKMQSSTAAWAALQPPPIGLGPIAGEGLAASIKGWAAADIGMVAALGALEMSNVNAGNNSATGSSGGSGGYSGTSPALTGSNQSIPTQREGSVNIYIQGPSNEEFILNEVVPMIQEVVENRDVILIRSDSRNGQTLMGN